MVGRGEGDLIGHPKIVVNENEGYFSSNRSTEDMHRRPFCTLPRLIASLVLGDRLFCRTSLSKTLCAGA